MAHDPTKWPSSMQAWSYWLARSSEREKEVFEIEEAFVARYGADKITILRMAEDPDYKLASARQQYAERRAATFGLAVMIRLLEASIAETRRLNTLVERLLEAPEESG